MPNINNLTEQDKQWGAQWWSSPGFIDGLKMEWVSGTSLRVTSGCAYIESMARNAVSQFAITKAGLSLSASTWYHVYLFLNAGVPDIEIVTTAPSAPYSGTARSKTGYTSRRYIGSIRTQASGSIFRFRQQGSKVLYQGDIGAGTTGEYRILNGGVATVSTTISLSALVPITSTRACVRAFNTADAAYRLDNSQSGNTIPASIFSLSPGNATAVNAFVDIDTDSSQAVTYFMFTPPTVGGAFLDILGYIYER